MAKTKEELMQLKKEYEAINKKLKELSEEELNVIAAGAFQQREAELQGRSDAAFTWSPSTGN